MGIFLRFILPSLFRRCLDHRIGPHSPMLHFCREPNLASSRREPLLLSPGRHCPLGGTSLDASVHQLRRILPFQRAAHRCRLLSSPIRRLGLGLIPFVVKGTINCPWYQEVESNHRHTGYESVVLPTELSWHMYKGASCVDRSHTTISR